jgi:tRNA (guanine-N7-)-methyltransferase
MAGNSRFISSAQDGPHRDLDELVRRHMAHPFRKPIARLQPGSLTTALAARAAWNPEAPLILDAGCGVGWSTQRIAETFPDHFVFGVDQSVDRISRGKPLPMPANALLIRADLVDFWRLLAESGIRLARHYNLYPESVAEDRPSRPALARPCGFPRLARTGRRTRMPEQLANLH